MYFYIESIIWFVFLMCVFNCNRNHYFPHESFNKSFKMKMLYTELFVPVEDTVSNWNKIIVQKLCANLITENLSIYIHMVLNILIIRKSIPY